ncbi:MAG: dTDP-4-dehydrorhamnose 3,5-epimerase family protein [Alphaproteobacteria bacterium]|nr:dTDP-4-dehydrorhamnose 3,5-epimerase family protein [Alphaproteobacteria bacterium]
MNIIDTKIEGVKIVTAMTIGDNRGSFSRWFCPRQLEPLIGDRKIFQINHSMTLQKGSIRGMHYQRPPHSEMKFVRCIRGRVWDVALDVRKNSPTFLQWHAEELSAENARMMVVPEHCAHGFQVLEPGSELLYLHTAFYEPSAEGGVNFSDPLAGIDWPLPAADISARDIALPFLTADFKGV